MYLFNRLTAIVLTAVLLGPMLPLEAKTKKGDKFLAEGRVHEQKKEWDAALEAYDKALSEDPADIVYQMASTKVHFGRSIHIDKGLKLRGAGQLGEAPSNCRRPCINPGRRRQPGSPAHHGHDRAGAQRVEETGKESSPKERAMTEGEKAKKETEDRISSILPVPELRPIDQNPIHLRMNGSAKLLFETVAKVAGLNVLWDPEYQPQVRGNIPVEFEKSTLDEALDYLAVITKSYWKPLSPNTIFITMDNPNAARLRGAGGEGFLSGQRQYAAGIAGNRQRGTLGGGHTALLSLQRAERHHCKGQRGPGGPGGEDSARSGQTEE
jgi:general secretion pathway protein D